MKTSSELACTVLAIIVVASFNLSTRFGYSDCRTMHAALLRHSFDEHDDKQSTPYTASIEVGPTQRNATQRAEAPT